MFALIVNHQPFITLTRNVRSVTREILSLSSEFDTT